MTAFFLGDPDLDGIDDDAPDLDPDDLDDYDPYEEHPSLSAAERNPSLCS
jgi:hypothetical protein